MILVFYRKWVPSENQSSLNEGAIVTPPVFDILLKPPQPFTGLFLMIVQNWQLFF